MRKAIKRFVASLHHHLESPSRPFLKPGDRIDVHFHDPDMVDPWVPHEFVAWADTPQMCEACGAMHSRPRMAVQSLVGEKRLIVVSYNLPTPANKFWRIVNPRHPWWQHAAAMLVLWRSLND